MLKIPAVKKDTLTGVLTLPSSKSISHRYLIIQALSQVGKIQLEQLSESTDTRILRQALTETSTAIDFEDAGTPMRFFLAYAALEDLRVIITGNNGLKARPIAPLVDAISQLGCRIKYLEKFGCLPLQIEKGIDLNSTEVRIDTELSSQFLSALLLISPCFNRGLKIISTGKITSSTYIALTIDSMLKCGVKVEENINEYIIQPGIYLNNSPITIEADWSAAAFVFAWSTALPSSFEIKGLNLNSKQGDKISLEFFERLGVEILPSPKADSILISSHHLSKPAFIEFDFTHTPDMFPIVAATCAFLKIKAHFTGIKNLTIKESNRIVAMQNNLIQTGANFNIINENELLLDFDVCSTEAYTFESYSDHRIAMACSIFAFEKPITIDNETVVNKSFPNYWELFLNMAIN